MELKREIAEGRATHIQTIDIDHVVLYRGKEQSKKLELARVGCGIRGREGFTERDDWFRIATEKWENCCGIPTTHPLWPARKI